MKKVEKKAKEVKRRARKSRGFEAAQGKDQPELTKAMTLLSKSYPEAPASQIERYLLVVGAGRYLALNSYGKKKEK